MIAIDENVPIILNKIKHRLSSIDKSSMTAQCSVCGPVSIKKKKNGKGKIGYGCKPANDRYRNGRWKTMFVIGMTVEDIQREVNIVQGNCSICEKDLNDKFAIDHDHKTGKFRGILCNSCNVGLGHFRDDVKILNKAIAYLKSN
jgi:hypothetical protein